MTNEEAIKRLKEGAPFSELYYEWWEEALNMAIKALEDSRCRCPCDRTELTRTAFNSSNGKLVG